MVDEDDNKQDKLKTGDKLPPKDDTVKKKKGFFGRLFGKKKKE
jgi:hypothetical protein